MWQPLWVCWDCTFRIRHPQTTLCSSSSNSGCLLWWLESSTRQISESAWRSTFLDPPELQGCHASSEAKSFRPWWNSKTPRFCFLLSWASALEHAQLWERLWVSSLPWYFFSLFFSNLYRQKESHWTFFIIGVCGFLHPVSEHLNSFPHWGLYLGYIPYF